MPGESFAGRIETADWVAVTAFATISRHNVEIAILAFITIAADDIGLAAASARYLITNRHAEVRLLGALRIAGALVAIAMRQCQRIAKVPGQTLFTVRSGRVMDAFQALAGCTIAIANGIRIHIAITVA